VCQKRELHPWGTLQDSWLLVQVDRWFRTHVNESFLSEFVVMCSEIVLHQTRWDKSSMWRWNTLRRPVIAELGGCWYVSVCMGSGDVLQAHKQYALPCATLPLALAAWSAWMRLDPFGSLLLNGKQVQTLLDVLQTEGEASAAMVAYEAYTQISSSNSSESRD